MRKTKKKYIKPQIKGKNVKIAYFLSKIAWVNPFDFVGTVYASNDCSCSSGNS